MKPTAQSEMKDSSNRLFNKKNVSKTYSTYKTKLYPTCKNQLLINNPYQYSLSVDRSKEPVPHQVHLK